MYGNGTFVTNCEEAYQIETPEKFDTVVESIRGSNESDDFFKQVTVTFNPWNERHWLKEMFFDEETKRDNTFSTTTTFRVNEWLDDVDRQRYIDLYEKNPRRARIVADGEWGVAEGLVFENFEVKDFDINATIQRVGLTTHGMDFGFTHDPTTIPSLAVDLKNKELWIYGETYKHGLLSSDIAKEVRNRGLSKSRIIADGAEPRTIAELNNNHGLNVVAAPKPKGSIMQGINYMKEFKIYIHPSCVHTLEEFETYTYKEDKVSGKYLNEPIDDNNHIIDGIRYSLTPFHIEMKPKQNVKKKTQQLKRLGL